MKNLWLPALLVLSLGVNAGVLTVYAARQYQRLRWEERMVRTVVKDRAALRQMDREYATLMRQGDSLRELGWQARRELGRLGLEENPDPAAVESTIGRMVGADRSHWAVMTERLHRIRELERPEFRAKLHRLDQQWVKSIDSIREVDSSERAQERR